MFGIHSLVMRIKLSTNLVPFAKSQIERINNSKWINVVYIDFSKAVEWFRKFQHGDILQRVCSDTVELNTFTHARYFIERYKCDSNAIYKAAPK